jgi:hexokinase
MKKKLFELGNEQLVRIAETLKERIGEGLGEKGKEISALPTYVNPSKDVEGKKVLVLDLGGTNCRVAVVEFDKTGKPILHPEGGWKKDLSKIMKNPECKKKDLFKEIADLVGSTNLEGVDSIGYCFSYPAASTIEGEKIRVEDETEDGKKIKKEYEAKEGDAILLRWTKGVNIPYMVGHLVGQELMDYLNADERIKGKTQFKKIKVINDTIASLFFGLDDSSANARIGLIVGTGTNMAAFFPSKAIPKLDKRYSSVDKVPINLESGNFNPPFLSFVDEKIDRYSSSPGEQRFEKAISGMYLGRILEFIFPTDEFEADFDASKLTRIMSFPDMYKEPYAEWAHVIYIRSARLVAASLAGLISKMIEIETDKKIENIRLTAEGSLFWSSDKSYKKDKYVSYKDMVMDTLSELLDSLDLKNVRVHVEKRDNANMIGSAIAGLS